MIRALGAAADWLESQSPENLESNIPYIPLRIIEEEELSEVQKQLLKEVMRMFAGSHDVQKNLYELQAMVHLLSNPDTEITLQPSERGAGNSLFLFEEKISIRHLVEIAMGLIRLRKVKTDPKYLPTHKAIIKKDIPKKKDETMFSVDPQDLQKVRMNFAKRKKTKNVLKGKNKFLFPNGRIIGFSKDRISSIAVVPTILNAVQKGGYDLAKKRFDMQSDDFLYPRYEETVSYNIMLVLDTSSSISWFIPHIEKMISYITSNVSCSRDKLGLITFHNDLARIYHYPTANVRQVVGTINKIKVQGHTPLGDGLNLALQVFSKDRYHLSGTKNMLVLISDCFPEPLEGGHKDLLDEPCYKSVIAAAEKIRDQNLGFIIINPHSQEVDKVTWGKNLIDKVLDITRAKYVEVPANIRFNLLKGERAIIESDTMTNFFEAMNDVKVRL